MLSGDIYLGLLAAKLLPDGSIVTAVMSYPFRSQASSLLSVVLTVACMRSNSVV